MADPQKIENVSIVDIEVALATVLDLEGVIGYSMSSLQKSIMRHLDDDHSLLEEWKKIAKTHHLAIRITIEPVKKPWEVED